ncbi:hypothetical protein ACFLYK_00165 [Candidatus Cloacimonadota bacterium]
MIKRTILVVTLLLLIITGCNDNSTGPDAEFQMTLVILQDGEVQDTYTLTEDDNGEILNVAWDGEQIGTVEISTLEIFSEFKDVQMETRFLIHARKNSSFSIIDPCGDNGTIEIDYQTDFVQYPANTNCGVLYDMVWGSIPGIIFEVFLDTVLVDSITTGEFGDFVTDLEPAEYTLVAMGFYNVIQLQEGYHDYSILFSECVEKPNIYLYPETEISLDVNITFPQKGRVSTSIPEFPAEWKDLKITPDGRIYDKYDYLYYETEQQPLFTPGKGWIIARKELESFFRYNMKQTGFIDREIEDFITYWIPRFTDSEYYAIYPQYNKQIDPLIKLEFSQQPDSILRLIYLVQECESKDLELEAPVIPVFSSEGFVVREWGVVRN